MKGVHITPSASAGWGDHSVQHAGMPEVFRLALQIADEAARSDIECYAAGEWIKGICWYDLNKAEVSGKFDADDIEHALSIANRAARYIERRGEALTYRMVRHAARPSLVRFEVQA